PTPRPTLVPYTTLFRSQAVSYPQGPGPASESVQKLVVDFSVHDHATGCCATLTGRAKPSPDRSIHSQVQLCVVHDNDDVLSTHLDRKSTRLNSSHVEIS